MPTVWHSHKHCKIEAALEWVMDFLRKLDCLFKNK